MTPGIFGPIYEMRQKSGSLVALNHQNREDPRESEAEMNELTNGVSWAAVFGGAIVSFLVGWLWYSERLFGKGWSEGVGVELGSSNDMPMAAMIMQAVGLLLMSWFVSVTAASNLLLTVILATLAFTFMGAAGSMFRRNSTYARHVDGGNWIVALIIMVIANVIF